ncbi:hypothetical protein [uncultured Sphingomonas sp.]|uniref:hypothetical protein n=1 Tax=uncultured Sphingomonas sp. TaxID=158754 RepID=UPI0025E0D05A|nr:hypothetical protein [uncultured Sphingomonas sp.]
MAKVVKTVALIAVAVAIVVVAAPFAGAVAGLYGASAATVAAISSAVVGIGLSIGLGAIGTLFRKSATMSSSMADRLQTQIVPAAPRKIVFGRSAAGNDERFFEVWGKNKDSYARVVVAASHRIHAFKKFYIENDETWNGSLVAHSDGIASLRTVTEGRPGNGFAVGSGAYWKSTATFTGCAYYAIQYKLSDKAWPSGIPARNTMEIEGCPLYDPRLDSSRGGSGPHRIEDQSTWSFYSGTIEIGRNPANALLTYLIGYRINGKLAWGMGVPPSAINFDNFRKYANVCEERVQIATGGTTQRYTCDGIYSTSDTHESVIASITAAMGCTKLVDVAGTYSLIGGYDDTLGPKHAFDDGDIIGMGSWVPAGPLRETYNIVEGKFPDPDELFQVNSWGKIETAPAADGIPRSLTLDLGCVGRAETCQRIAKQFIAREQLTPGHFTATFGPKAFAVQIGDLLTLSHGVRSWNNKLFRVIEQQEVHDMFYQMTLREENPEVFAWDKDEAKPVPFNLRPPGYDASMKISIEGLRLSTITYQGVS